MNDDFICYGSYDDRFRSCLLTCPDRRSCERLTTLNNELRKLDRGKVDETNSRRDGDMQRVQTERQ